MYLVYGSYTNANATNVTSSSSSSPSSSSPSPTSTLQGPILASSTAGATPYPKSKSKPVVAIALGSLFGVLGLLLIVGGLWYLFQRRKRPVSEAWTVDGAPSMSSIGPDGTHKNENWSAEQLYGYSAQPGKLWPHYENARMPAPPVPSQPYYHGGYQNDISSHITTGRTPNRYEPGYALSTITEVSTPQIGEGRTPQANSPASYQSELEYYTAQGSEASYSVFGLQQQPPPSQRTPSSVIAQGYPAQRRKPVEHKLAGNRI